MAFVHDFPFFSHRKLLLLTVKPQLTNKYPSEFREIPIMNLTLNDSISKEIEVNGSKSRENCRDENQLLISSEVYSAMCQCVCVYIHVGRSALVMVHNQIKIV